ncbi:MAG: sigma-70 family RNA polymerase sigma factor [Clostridia bacterium]|nr:sigma-70 family RNA polymerase sigma factor [Clostridia bacterium]
MQNRVIICGIDTSTLPKIGEEESVLLLEKIAQKDGEAREKFIVSNMRLVLSVVKRFWAKKTNQDDLFQAGVIGLIKAIDNFDLKYGVKFSTYAVPMIIGEIKRYVKGNNSLRVARSIRDTAYHALQTRTELEREDKDVSIENVAKEMNMPVSEVAYCLDAIKDTVSLFEPVYNKNGDELYLFDQISDEKNTDELWTENCAITSSINRLEKKERDVIIYRYYVGKTQTEISEQIGISQAQVSRIEKSALQNIKTGIRV